MNPFRRTIFRRIFGIARLAIGGAVLAFSGLAANAQLIVLNEPFNSTTMSPSWVVGGSNYTPTLTAATGVDAPGSGWLRLTSAGGQQATYAYDTNSFNGENATIAVKFSYAAYGGTGADGITFFLADASKPFAVGAYGGSLGYAQKTLAGGGEANIQGMSGGYIGLGIDEFGNYSNATEGRIGGEGFFKPNVSIRGPGQGYAGYEYLGGTGQLDTPIAFSGTTRPTGDDARVFQIIITATNQLTVYMQAGANAPMEALYSIDLSGYARPEDLILGFTGSTGGSTNIHEIQGLNLTSLKADVWTNGGGTSTWANGSNWDNSDGSIPAAGADILLDNRYVNTPQNIDVGGTRIVRSVQIDAPFAYTLNNGTLRFSDQGVLGPSGIYVSKGNGSANHVVNSALVADNAIEIKNSSTGLLSLTGSFDTNGNAVVLSGTGEVSLSGVVSGSGNLTKSGTGNAILSGANTYAGGTTLRSGTLTVGNNAALGTGTVTLKGGTLTANGGQTIANPLTLQGNTTLSGIGTSGPLTQTNGNYTLNLANATHSGTVNLSNNNTARTLTIGVNTGADSTISGVIQNGGSGAGSLTKTGTGVLTLSGANTYTGTTTIAAGTLRLGADNVFASNSSIDIAGGTLNLAGYSNRVGDLSFSNNGVLDFGTGTAANNFVFGNIVSQSGVLTINNWTEDINNLASTVSGLNVGSIYFSGFGLAEQDTGTTNIGGYGSAYVIRPSTQNWRTWIGTGTSWPTNSNWSPSGDPVNGQYARFTNNSSSSTVSLSGNRTISGIRFDSTAKAYTINNGSGSRTLTLDNPTAGAIAFVQQQSASNQTFSFTTLQLNRNTVFDVTGSGNLVVNSRITGASNLIKEGSGAGRLMLSANNSGLTGNIFINAGIVRISNSGALGSSTGNSTTIGEGATLEITNGISSAETISFAGTGAGGIGALHNVSGNNTLSGPLSYTTNTRINSSTGTLTLSGPVTSSTNRELRLGGAGNITASGVIGIGGGDLVVDSTGTITFQGTAANTYTGTTRVESGTLVLGKTAGLDAVVGNLVIGDGAGATASVRLNAADQINDASRVTINSDGGLNLAGRAETIGPLSGSGRIENVSGTAATLRIGGTDSTTFSGAIDQSSGAITLIKQDGGKLTLTSSLSDYTGGTTIESGIIAVGASQAVGTGSVTVQSGGNLELMGGVTLANTMLLNGPGTLANDGAVQSTAGSNTLSGTITLQSDSRFVADSATALTLSGAAAITSNGTPRNISFGGGGDISVSKVIGSSTAANNIGTLTKDGSGTLVLSGANLFAGATSINAGTLEIRHATALGTTAGATTVANGATLAVSNAITSAEGLTISGTGHADAGALRNLGGTNTLSGTIALGAASTIAVDAGSLTASGVISGAAGSTLTKSGAGTLTLSGTGANTFGGGLTVNDGTVILAKTANLSATGTGNVTIGDSTGSANSAVVQLNTANQISGSAAVMLASDGRLNLNNQNLTIGSVAGSGSVTLGTGANTLTVGNASNTIFSGTLSGTGAVAKTGTGTLTLAQAAGSNAFAPGTLTVSQGVLELGASNIISDSATLRLSGGTFRVGGDFSDLVGNLSLTATSTIDFSDATSMLTFVNATRTGGTLVIDNWAGDFSGGGASQLFFSNAAGTFGATDITFTGYGAGYTRLASGEIVPNTGITYTWNSTGGGTWTETTKWTPTSGANGPDAVGASVSFAGSITADSTITLASAKRVGYMSFNDNNRYTISGGSLTLDVNSGSAQINVSNSGGGRIASAITLNDNLILNQNSTGLFEIAGGITGTNRNITVAGTGETTLSGAIATGTGTFTKNGSGIVTLSGTNTFTGATTVNGGTLAISSENNLGNNPGALNAGQLTLNGGTLRTTTTAVTINDANRGVTIGTNGGTFETISNLTIGTAGATTNILTINGTLTKTGAGTLSLIGNGANVGNGAIVVNEGTLSIAKGANVSAIGDTAAVSVGSGAVLGFAGVTAYNAETIGSLAGSGNVTNTGSTAFTLTTGGNNTSTTFGGALGGALALTKVGNGTFTLAGGNSHTGATLVNAGTLTLQHSSALGSTAAGTTVASGATLALDAAALNIGAEALALAGTGVGGNGALRNVTGTNTFAGAVTLSGTNTRIQSDAGSLTLSGSIGGAAQNLTIGGTGSTTLSGAIGTTTGTLTKADSGYAILSGTNTYAGTTTVSGGVLEIRNNAALGTTAAGTTVSAGATLALSGNVSTADALTLNASGYGAAGALRSLSGTNTASGAVTLGSSSLIGVDSGTLTVSGVVSGTGMTLAKGGAGTLVLSGTNTYTGGTIVSGGTLQIGADRGLGAVPGAATAGSLTLNGGALATTAGFALSSNRGIALGDAGGTIDTVAGTLSYGGILAGTGSLTKAGAGTLTLTGSNTYSGTTNIVGGRLNIDNDARLGAVPGSARSDSINLNGGTLATTATMTLNANRGIAVGSSGGTLNVATATTLTFGGTITGPGELTLALGGTGVFNLTSDIDFSSGTVLLSGGTFRLTNVDLSVGTFRITGNTILDFAGSASSITATNFIIDAGATLTVNNWANGIDYFLADHWWTNASMTTEVSGPRGTAPQNQVVFSGFSGNATGWVTYDATYAQITPVPEPSTYGALFLGACAGFFLWRRWRKPQASRK